MQYWIDELVTKVKQEFPQQGTLEFELELLQLQIDLLEAEAFSIKHMIYAQDLIGKK